MKIKAFTLLFIFFTTFSFGQSNDVYQKVVDSLLKVKKYDTLIDYFDKELKKYPKNENVLRWLGHVHIIKKNLDLGEDFYLQALEVNPNCARCYLNLGRVYSMRGNNEKALEFLDKAIIKDAKDALIYSDRARLKEMLGDNFGALRDHNKAIDLDSSNADYYVQSGLFNANSGYESMAIADFNKAIEIAPENYNPYFRRASIYYGQQRFADAMIDLNKALALDSSQQSLYIGRGAVYDVMQEYEKAIDDYTKAISIDSTNFLPYLNRAGSHYKLEDLDASCKDYFVLNELVEKGLVVDQNVIDEINVGLLNHCDSTRPSYYYQRGVGYYNLNDFNRAIEFYEEGLTIFPQNAMLHTFKGNAHLAMKQYNKATSSYNSSLTFKDNFLTELKENPKFKDFSPEQIESYYRGSLASTYYSISECKINLELWEEALENINNALTIGTGIEFLQLESYYNLRGHVYLMTGELEKAIIDFNKSIRINKNFPLAYVNRAIARVSLSEKVKITSYSVRGNINNESVGMKWDILNQKSSKNSNENIISALSDCNMAIQLNDKLGFAYYIRGQIKKMLIQPGYCHDLFTARELGQIVEDDLLRDCNR